MSETKKQHGIPRAAFLRSVLPSYENVLEKVQDRITHPGVSSSGIFHPEFHGTR